MRLGSRTENFDIGPELHEVIFRQMPSTALFEAICCEQQELGKQG
jgi:hypothetical protein